jgi:CheY-like chemotaxis protein
MNDGLSEHAAILVVDDNEMNRDLLSRRLLKKGFAVDVAKDGFKALEWIESNPCFRSCCAATAPWWVNLPLPGPPRAFLYAISAWIALCEELSTH